MRRRLKCMTCGGRKFLVFANFYEGGKTMSQMGDTQYVCDRCGEEMELEWIEVE